MTYIQSVLVEKIVFGGSFSEFEPFSNWGKFPVEHDGRSFPTLEHAYMHTKCMVNGDVTAAAAVLQCTEPYQAKEIGDKVKVTDVWDFSKREAVMKTLIDVKFSKDPLSQKSYWTLGRRS